jgi:hypothetical protein
MKIAIDHMPAVRLRPKIQCLDRAADLPALELPSPNRMIADGALSDGVREVIRLHPLNRHSGRGVPTSLEAHPVAPRISPAKEESLYRLRLRQRSGEGSVLGWH